MLPQVWAEIIGVSWATRKHAKHVTRSVASSKSLLKMPQISKLRLLLYGNWYLFGETRPDLAHPHPMWGYMPRPLPSWPLLAMTTAFLSRKKQSRGNWGILQSQHVPTHVHQIYELLIDISFHLSSNSIIYIYIFNGPSILWNFAWFLYPDLLYPTWLSRVLRP